MGECARRYAGRFRVFQELRKMMSKEAFLEPVVKRARATIHPLLIDSIANMSSEHFQNMWFKVRKMFKEATYRSKGPEGEFAISRMNIKRDFRSAAWLPDMFLVAIVAQAILAQAISSLTHVATAC